MIKRLKIRKFLTVRLRLAVYTAVFLVALKTTAVCVYLQEKNMLWVYDYAEAFPAGPRQLLFADQLNEWGVITYDAAKDIYIVNAALCIGNDEQCNTFFQIGRPDHPNETLILKGNLVIHPPAHRHVNCLTLGIPDHPEVRPRLLFQNTAKERFSIHAGPYYRSNSMESGINAGGELRIYHGEIAPVDLQYPIARHLYLYLEKVIFQNALIRGVAGTVGYGLGTHNSTLSGTVFEESENAFAWGKQEMRGMTFRRIKKVFSDSSRYPLLATLTDCHFEDNDVNWDLISGRIYLIDCDVGMPRKGNFYAALTNATTSNIAATVVSSRHVIFKIIDKSSKPVAKTRVEVVCIQNAQNRQIAETDANGLTPRRSNPQALLLDEWEERSGTTANQPLRQDFSYTVQVTSQKGSAIVCLQDFKPTQSWQIVELVLP